MNGLTIVGLCLIVPFAFVFVTILIVEIIDIIKEDPLGFIVGLIALMGLVGLILLCISKYS